jgi:hypothetical protein
MTRRTWAAVAAAAISLVAAVYLYIDNRRLARRVDALAAAARTPAAPLASGDPWASGGDRAADRPDRQEVDRGLGKVDSGGPQLPEEQKETRLERRVRRQQELAAFLGRLDGETEEE